MSSNHDEPGTESPRTRPRAETPGQESVLASVEPEIVKAVMKPLLGMCGLVFLLLIVSYLPGLHQVIPATPITLASLIIAIFTLSIVGVLVYVAPQLEQLLKQKFGDTNPLVADVAAITKQLNLLIAVIIAHWGLADALLPFFSDSNVRWLYDVTFLTLALIPTAFIAFHLYRSLDPAAELLTRKITMSSGSTGYSEPPIATGVDSRTGGTQQRITASSGTPPTPSWGVFPLVKDLLAINPIAWVGNAARKESASANDVLTKKEKVLQILEEHDGRIQQTAIVEMTGWSKSTVSRILSEMNEENTIVKTSIGQGNLITLPSDNPDDIQSTSVEQERPSR